MHTAVWLSWVLLVMAVALTASNPLYLAVVLLAVLLVAALAPQAEVGGGFGALLVFGAGTMALSLVISLVNGSYGDHILFTIPGPEIPRRLGGLSLGGPVSAEGLVAAAVRGLGIFCVLLGFAVFNRAVNPQRVLRMAPAALFHASIVVTIGLTLLPASVEDVKRVREMRSLRGAPSGIRALPGLVVPGVIGGLERSMRLAEAMEARGYAAVPASGRGQRWATVSMPLFAAATWLWFYYSSLRPLAISFAACGVLSLGWWSVSAGRPRRTTRLRDEPMAAPSRLAALASAGLAVAVVALGSTGTLDVDYNPFAGLHAPPFSAPGATVALACAWPVFFLSGGRRSPAAVDPTARALRKAATE